MATRITWYDRELLNAVAQSADVATKEAAEFVAQKARQNLANISKTLANEIDVRPSQFKAGGWTVWAQGSKNYTKFFASFVELGHYSSLWGKYKRPRGGSLKGISPIYIRPKPYMRPALRSLKRNAKRFFENRLK